MTNDKTGLDRTDILRVLRNTSFLMATDKDFISQDLERNAKEITFNVINRDLRQVLHEVWQRGRKYDAEQESLARLQRDLTAIVLNVLKIKARLDVAPRRFEPFWPLSGESYTWPCASVSMDKHIGARVVHVTTFPGLTVKNDNGSTDIFCKAIVDFKDTP